MKFSTKRFWLLFKKQWVENRKLYLLAALALAGLMSVVALLSIIAGGFSEETQKVFLVIGLLFSGSLFTSTILNKFANKIKGIEALMLPASTLEKVAVALLSCLVLFPAAYMLLVYPVILLAHYADTEVAGNMNALYRFGFHDSERIFIVLFIYLQSFILLFSVIFRRFIFLKSVILVCIIFFCLIPGNNYLAHKLVENVQPGSAVTVEEVKALGTFSSFHFRGAAPLGPMEFSSRESRFQVSLPGWQAILFQLIKYLILPFLWYLAWLRLREMEL